ncbi:hypothetical protein [Pedobacter sp. KLB.chiD]|uniref:hypothetical protein n=1 Tax=Pedobacter sp. KLB.chiD TaxID=3387402 RepID=UPI00399A7F1F
MKKSQSAFLIISFFLFACSCASNQKPLKFVRLDQFSNGNAKVDSLSLPGDYTEYFIISNWKDNKECSQQLNEFVLKRINQDVFKYINFSMSFYLESNITNVQHLKTDPRDLDRYSNDHDRKFTYSWSKGQFLSIFEFKDGMISGGEHITISEAPPLKSKD